MTREDIYKIIDGERAYQEARWNPNTTDSGGKHSPTEFLLYMQDYLTEAIHQASRFPDPQSSEMVLDTMRKVVTLGIACFEQHGVPPRKTEGV